MGRSYSGETAWRRSRIVVPVASPAAGSDWSLTVPAGHVYRLVSIYGELVTSAAVATRVPFLTVSDGVSAFLKVPPFASQVASLTRRYAWFPESGGDATGLGIASPFPGLALVAGWSLAAATDLLDVADQWSSVRVCVEDTTVQDGSVDIDGLPDLLVEIVGGK